MPIKQITASTDFKTRKSHSTWPVFKDKIKSTFKRCLSISYCCSSVEPIEYATNWYCLTYRPTSIQKLKTRNPALFFSNFVCSFLIQSESGSVFMSTNLRQTFSSRKISLNEACLTQWGSRRLKSIWVLLSKSSHEREREGEDQLETTMV